ncbi:MAG: TonB-dependent receptor family protein [Hyphomicrobiaceae bacterium]
MTREGRGIVRHRTGPGKYAKRAIGISLGATFAIGHVPLAISQSAAPGAPIALPGIEVEAPRQATSVPAKAKAKAAPRAATPRRAASPAVETAPQPTAPQPAGSDTAQATTAEDVSRQRLDAIAGGTAVVGGSDVAGRANVTIADTLATVPGVIVQSFFGGNDQPRIQMRGSGLQQNPVERGILVLQDGLPINRADGSYVVGLADPRLAEFIEVYRGYTANRLGATVLGGAINFASPTGLSAPGVVVGVEGGSFGRLTASAQVGAQQGNLDGLAQVSTTHRDGFRDYNESDRTSASINAGARISENITTRVFMGYTHLGFDVAGPLTKEAMEQDPRQVHRGPSVIGGVAVNPGPNVIRDRPRRETDQFRIGSRTTATFGPHLFDVAVGYTYNDDVFRFPISGGIRSTAGGDATGVVRYAYMPDKSRTLPLFETTAQYAWGTADRTYHQNLSGKEGALFGENDLESSTLALYAGLNLPIGARVTVSPAISYAHASRINDDTFAGLTRPTAAYNPASPTQALPPGAVPNTDTSYTHRYSGWSPSLGIHYELAPQSSLFASVSRTFEPPTHDDLLATINGTPNSTPGRPQPGNPAFPAAAFATPDLDAQTATTVETGWRGRHGRLAWSSVAYYSWVDNELLNLRDVSGVSLGSVNADKTTHLGLELGLAAQITQQLSSRLAYTFQDFRFDDDPLHGNNRLAGAPTHTIIAALRYAFTPAFFAEAEVNWRPDKTPVDNANTLYADPFAIVTTRAAYDLTESIMLYGEVRNLFDKTYASSTLIVDQARPDQAAFLPGDGRAFIIGARARF